MMEETSIFTLDSEIIDIEWCFKNGHTPPLGRKYRYRVDHDYRVTPHCELTGEQVLASVGKNPKEYILREKINGSYVTIEPHEIVDLSKPGVEKFKTIKNEHTDGEQIEKSPRRDFSLIEEDEEFLNSLFLDWEAIRILNNNWVFIYDYPIPPGFNVNKVTVAVMIAPNYPTAQLDMLYFFPALSRKDGIRIPNLSNYPLEGKIFQQWSRHRTSANPWRVGLDCLATHIPLAEIWLNNEFTKRPTNALRA